MKRAQKLKPHYAFVLPVEDDLRGREADVARVTERVGSGQPGVVALVGIGGAGKTVLLSQVLDSLGASAEKGPDGLFVWTFYRDPDVDRFLREAHRYFTGKDSTAEGSLGHVYALVDALKEFGRGVLALDGIERLQSFAEDTPGRIEEAALRVLVERLAAGVGHATAIVTTRIGLRDLAKLPGYLELALDALPERAGAALLADRGVKGDEAARARLSAAYGGHPLTLSLLGRLLAEFYGGDPARAAEVAPLADVAGRPQEERLAAILAAFEKKLTRTEQAMLERMSAFRGDVTADLIGKVLLEPVQSGGVVARLKNWWSDPLGRLDAEGLIKAIDHLESLRIMHREGERDGRSVYAFHAAVKDHFYGRLLEGGASERVHESVRIHLASRPMSRKPETEDELDRMEELLFHTLACGRGEEAFRIYWDRLEGYEHLGRSLGAYSRGRRIALAFFKDGHVDDPVAGLTPWQAAMLAGDLGLYLEKLGELEPALECHLRTHAVARDAQDAANASVGLQNQASILNLQGMLVEARRVIARAQQQAEKDGDEDLRADCLTIVGYTEGMLGKLGASHAAFVEAKRMAAAAAGRDQPLLRRRGIRYAQVLVRAGEAARAMRALDANHEECRKRGWKQDAALCDALRAEAYATLGDLTRAKRSWREAEAFALRAGIQELVAMSHLAGARILRKAGEAEPAVEQVIEGLKVCRRVGLGLLTVDTLIVAGGLQLDARNEAAEETAREAHQLASSTACGYLWGQADALDLLARVHEAAGRAKEQSECMGAGERLRVRLAEGASLFREERA
ncbi:MAG: hypothetical protein ACOZNI_23385 [Myxococcota bacterium]